MTRLLIRIGFNPPLPPCGTLLAFVVRWLKGRSVADRRYQIRGIATQCLTDRIYWPSQRVSPSFAAIPRRLGFSLPNMLGLRWPPMTNATELPHGIAIRNRLFGL